jgi:hypothetical protein
MSLKNIYAPAPSTTRGQPTHISLHPDGSKLAYACGRTVVIRSISNALAADVYSEHAKNRDGSEDLAQVVMLMP